MWVWCLYFSSVCSNPFILSNIITTNPRFVLASLGFTFVCYNSVSCTYAAYSSDKVRKEIFIELILGEEFR